MDEKAQIVGYEVGFEAYRRQLMALGLLLCLLRLYAHQSSKTPGHENDSHLYYIIIHRGVTCSHVLT